MVFKITENEGKTKGPLQKVEEKYKNSGILSFKERALHELGLVKNNRT